MEIVASAAMPASWSDGISVVTDGVGSVLTTVTGDELLLVMSFGFIFIRKAIGLTKRLIKIGGKN